MESIQQLGERIQQARLAKHWGVKAAAEAAGISRDTWKKIEAGDSVQDAKRRAAMDAVDLAPEEGGLLTWEDVDRLGPRLNGIDRQLDELWRRVEQLEARVRPQEPGTGHVSSTMGSGQALSMLAASEQRRQVQELLDAHAEKELDFAAAMIQLVDLFTEKQIDGMAYQEAKRELESRQSVERSSERHVTGVPGTDSASETGSATSHRHVTDEPEDADEQLATAARRGPNRGKALREEHDQAETGSQDDGGMDPA